MASKSRNSPFGGRKSKLPLMVVSTVALLAAVGGGSYLVFGRGGAKAEAAKPGAPSVPTMTAQTPAAAAPGLRPAGPGSPPAVIPVSPPPSSAAAPAPAPVVRPAAPAPAAQPVVQSGTSLTRALDAAKPLAANPANPAAPAAAAPVVPNAQGGLQAQLDAGQKQLDAGAVVEGRTALSALLIDRYAELSTANRAWIREKLTAVNADYVWGKKTLADEDTVAVYQIKSGDSLERIGRGFKVPAGIIMAFNGISDPRRIREGQKLRIPKGPLHAAVSKADFRLDLYAVTEKGAKVFLKSYPVCHGKDNSTPTGKFLIVNKMKDPEWTDPDTGKKYAKDDPTNPIGDYWMALKGQDAATASLNGFGIHGTVEPDSIGKMMSHGCVRLGDKDIAELFGALLDSASTVEIKP